jgi:putative transposase
VTGTLADLPCHRAELLAENAQLRQQLMVLRRNTKTPRLTWRERLSLLVLARWVPNWKQVLQIIQPDTLLRWHREGFRLFWKLKSRRAVQTQPQRLVPETIAVIEPPVAATEAMAFSMAWRVRIRYGEQNGFGASY